MSKHPDYSSKSFLIVDDEPFMLSMIDRILKQFKTGTIIKATDGGSGLKAIKDNFTQVDCIISDCNMTPINGLQFLKGVRMGVNPRIPREQPFIMLTGHGETDLVKTAMQLDVNGYIVKPVSPDKLAETIDRVLGKSTDIKEPEYYKAISVPKVQSAFTESPSDAKRAWVLLPGDKPFKTSAALKEKIKKFQEEHATRDGEKDVKMKNKRQCEVSELVENQILAQDIEAEDGVILLRKGTHLSASMITRLRELYVEAGANQGVWVGDIDE